MTGPEVTDADRRAAADIVRSGAPGLGNGNRVIGDEIKGGLHDNYLVVQAFAKHRHDSTAALVALLKPFAEAADDLDDETPDRAEIWEMAAAMGITAGDLRAARNALRGEKL